MLENIINSPASYPKRFALTFAVIMHFYCKLRIEALLGKLI